VVGSLRGELLVLRKRASTRILLAIWATLALVFAYAVPYAQYLNGARQASLADVLPENLVGTLMGGFPFFGGVLALILGVLGFGSEYGWGTLKTLLVQGPRRLTVLTGQLLALLVVLAGTVVATFLVTALGSWAIAAGESAAVDWPTLGELVRGIGGGLLIAGAWGAMGMFLGTALRGTALPIGLGLVWILAIESLVVNVAAPLLHLFDVGQAVLPGVNAGSLVAALAGPDAVLRTPGVAAIVDGTQAAWALTGFLVLFAALTGLLLVRRDVT
jgi:ABC-2 type transport system permease protein